VLLRHLGGSPAAVLSPVAVALASFALLHPPLNSAGVASALALSAYNDVGNDRYTRAYRALRVAGTAFACACFLATVLEFLSLPQRSLDDNRRRQAIVLNRESLLDQQRTVEMDANSGRGNSTWISQLQDLLSNYHNH
jgi:hypothetical protein